MFKPAKQDRRAFLQTLTSGTVAAAALLPRESFSQTNAEQKFVATNKSTNKARAFVTSIDKRLQPVPLVNAADRKNVEVVEIDADTKFQEILGFGAAFTDAACYTLNRLDANVRKQLFNQLFSPSEMNLNVCRTTVAQSDYGVELYSYHDQPDKSLKDFSIDYDRRYIIPIIKEARRVNPDLFLFSSAWSPPGWMKTSNSMLGGWLREEFIEPYARYYLRYLAEYRRAGVEINALTAQNESETDQRAQMAACFWHPDYETKFVKLLAPLLAKEKLRARIWLLDHNYDQWQRPKLQLDDPELKRLVGGVAFHNYTGKPDAMTKLRDAHPDVPIFYTEAGPMLDRPNYFTEWTRWAAEFTQMTRNWAQSVTAWNFALDEAGLPNLGPYKCGGLLTVDRETKTVAASGMYRALAHFSRFVRRGARRTGSESAAAKLEHVAFVNPNGETAVILTNSGEQPRRTVAVEHNNNRFALDLPSDSIITLTISSE